MNLLNIVSIKVKLTIIDLYLNNCKILKAVR